MNFSFFKFLLKKGLAFPRSEEELDYVKENVFNNDEELETPTFEETWNYINDNTMNPDMDWKDIDEYPPKHSLKDG